MKGHFLISFLLVSFVFSFQGYGQDARKMAKKLNAGIDRKLDSLTVIKADTIAYYKAIKHLMRDAVLCDHFDAMADKKQSPLSLFESKAAFIFPPFTC